MKIRADLIHSPERLRPAWCQVEKVVELTGLDFDAFLIAPQEEQPFLADNAELMYQWNSVNYCLLVLAEGRTDGVLVDSEGGPCARYAAYLPQARALVNAGLEQAVDFVVRQSTEHTASGSWCVYCEELEEKFGLTIREGNGLDAMLLDALRRRPEVSNARLIDGCVAATCRLDLQEDLDAPKKQVSAPFTTERKAELFEKAVSALCEIFDHEDLYPMLHNGLGLTLQEIRTHGYMSDRELSETCQVPRQVLDCGMKVRDILGLDGISGRVCLSHGNSDCAVPLEELKRLTNGSLEEFPALLDAQVVDIRLNNDETPELVLGGVEAEELERLHDMIESPEQAGQTMEPMQ